MRVVTIIVTMCLLSLIVPFAPSHVMAGTVPCPNATVATTSLLPSLIFPTASACPGFPHAPIVINGNSGFNATNGVTGGTGTASSPFVISDWDIDLGQGGCYCLGIEVQNTNAHFVIRNVYVHNGDYGSQDIVFSNVTNGVFENSTLANTYSGIRITGSSHVTVSWNNMSTPGFSTGGQGLYGGPCLGIDSSSYISVSQNNFSSCFFAGMDLTRGSGDSHIIISENNFYGDGSGSIGVYLGTVGFTTLTDNRFSQNYVDVWVPSGSSITNTTVSSNIFSGRGIYLEIPTSSTSGFPTLRSDTISTDNTVNGAPLYYFESSSGITLDNVPVGQIIVINSTNFRASNLRIANVVQAIFLNNVHGGVISAVDIANTMFFGIMASESDHVIITNSSMTGSSINFYYTSYMQVYHNNLRGLVCCSGLVEDSSGRNNLFDNGYPSGGNFWYNYPGVDNCNGPQQNICTGPDGIGDTSFGLDRYPLMKPFAAAPLVSVVVGIDGNLYSSISRPDGSWNSWQSLSGSTSSTPALCRAGPDRVELVVRGMDNVIYHKSNINGTWSAGWESLGGLTPDQTACAVLNGTLYVVVRGMGEALYYETVNLSTDAKSGWIYLSGSSPSSPALCVSGSSSLELFVRGEDNGLYHKSFTAGSWSNSWDKNPSGVIFDTPACAVLGTVLYVVVRGSSSELWSTTFDLSSKNWAVSWVDLQGSTPSVPALAATPVLDRIDLVVTGMDGGIYHKSLVNGVWASGWDGPNGATQRSISMVSDGSHLRMVVVEMDGSLVSNMLPLSSSVWSGWTSMNGSTNSAPSAG